MSPSGFSAEERAAMKQRSEELRSTKGLKGAAKQARELEACIEAIDGLEGTDHAVAIMLHRIMTDEAPQLAPKTWYGFPSYAKDGTVIVFYQQASKFKTRYGTVNFSDEATLGEGAMWATSFAVVDVTAEVEQELRALVRKATQ